VEFPLLDLDPGMLTRLRTVAREALPIFPLPRTVLLPGAMLPLHVFEPRYRELVQACIDGHEMMGIATLKPGYEEDYEGRPAVWPEIGVGVIVAHQPLDDGRRNILLRYVGRGLLDEELPARSPFREVTLRLLEDRPPDDPRPYASLRALVQLVGRYSAQAAVEAERLSGMEGSDMVDALARKLLDDPDLQRSYLAEIRITERARVVEGALAEVVAAATSVSGEA
jgi:Lon protease-like protein